MDILSENCFYFPNFKSNIFFFLYISTIHIYIQLPYIYIYLLIYVYLYIYIWAFKVRLNLLIFTYLHYNELSNIILEAIFRYKNYFTKVKI